MSKEAASARWGHELFGRNSKKRVERARMKRTEIEP